MGSGESLREFAVHEDFLSKGSDFFRRALGEHWEESKTRIIAMPEDDPAAFELYMHRIYTSKFPTYNVGGDDEAVENQRILDTAKLYVFADKIQDSAVKDMAWTRFHDLLKYQDVEKTPSKASAWFIYNNTAVGSKMRQILVHSWLRTRGYDLSDHMDELPGEFVRDLVRMLWNPRLRKDGWEFEDE